MRSAAIRVLALLVAALAPSARARAQSITQSVSTYTLARPGEAQYDAGRSGVSATTYTLVHNCPANANAGCAVKLEYATAAPSPAISPAMTFEYRFVSLVKTKGNDQCTATTGVPVGATASFQAVTGVDVFSAAKGSECTAVFEFRVSNLSYATNVVANGQSLTTYRRSLTFTTRTLP